MRKAIAKFIEVLLTYYRMFLIGGLVIFVIIDWLWIMPQDKDFGVNLLTDSIFTIFTVIFLMSLIDYKENHRWKLVKDKVMRMIGFRLRRILEEDLIPLCKGTDVSYKRHVMEIKDMHGKGFLNVYIGDYSSVLEELSKRVELNDNSKKKMLKGDMGSLERSLEDNIQALSDLQVQHFKFLDAELVNSLMQIQENLRAIRFNMRPLTGSSRLPAHDRGIIDGLFELIRRRIHDTIKEIHKIDKKGEVPI